MEHESNLNLLKNTFLRCRVNFNIYSKEDLMTKSNATSDKEDFSNAISSELFTTVLSNIRAKATFSFTNKFGLIFQFMQIEEGYKPRYLIIGPYLHSALSETDLLILAEKNNLLPKYNNLLAEYLSLVPIIDPESHLFAMLEVFCESLWGQFYPHENLKNNTLDFNKDINALLEKHKSQVDQATMHLIEQKYDAENQMLDIVRFGQLHKLKARFSSLSDITLKKRLSDHLRDIKNYAIIANTLLRKSAEKGGVHPYYLDISSSNFAIRIESTRTSNECIKLIKEMFVAYCQLVSDLNTKRYSPVVESSIIYIMNNLSEHLTLSIVAKAQNVSKQYLSSVFKRNTQKTITEFITEKRMQRAVSLLTTTKLKIETISQHCGILDLQYFCKLFKKATGKSPKEYR